MSTIIPLMEAGFVDWIVSTGANLYHDTHFGLGLAMHRGTPFADDVELREAGVVRIYDIFFDYDVLLSTDAFFREISARPEFQRPMSSSAEYHHLLRRLRRGARAGARASCGSRCLSAAHTLRRADLHLVARRLLHRDERRRAGARWLGVASSTPTTT